jgi:hypothetical protein
VQGETDWTTGDNKISSTRLEDVTADVVTPATKEIDRV